MQIFPCPFCGPHDETEFHYVGEPKVRPDPAEAVGDDPWAEYLYFNTNQKDEAREIWLHLTWTFAADYLEHETVLAAE